MTNETATKTATAFETYSQLLAACQRGYVPSLRVGKGDDLPTRRAKTILVGALTANGCRVSE